MTEGTSRRAKRAQKKAAGDDVDLRPGDGVGVGPGADLAGTDGGVSDEDSGAAAVPEQRIKDRNQRLRAEAAARRRSKRDAERIESAPVGLDAGEMVDDALARATHAITQWLRRNFTLVQWVVLIAIVGGLGWQLYSWRAKKTAGKRSDVLGAALAKFGGWVGDTPSEETVKLFGTVRPTFPDEASRLKAATEAFNAVATEAPGSTTAMLAKLGLAGVLYQQGNYDAALKHYEALRGAEIFREDSDVRGRVLEGVALSLEAKGDPTGALKAFKALENSDLLGFEASGLYHQARLLFAQGRTEEAKKALVEAKKLLEESRAPDAVPQYLANSISELSEAVAPGSSATPSLQQLGGRQLSDDPEELQRLVDDLMKAKGSVAPGAPQSPSPPGPPAPQPLSPADAP